MNNMFFRSVFVILGSYIWHYECKTLPKLHKRVLYVYVRAVRLSSTFEAALFLEEEEPLIRRSPPAMHYITYWDQ